MNYLLFEIPCLDYYFFCIKYKRLNAREAMPSSIVIFSLNVLTVKPKEEEFENLYEAFIDNT